MSEKSFSRSLLGFIGAVCFGFSVSAKAVEVNRILPAGQNVTQADSINITFSEPMVALGEFEKTAGLPVQIIPPVPCEWRWISNSTLSCKLSEKTPLKPATSYQVIIRKNFPAMNGHKLSKDYGQTFTTQRPQATYSAFRRWLGPGMPVMDLNFNMPVTAGSLKKSLVLTENGVPVPIRVVYRGIEKLNFWGAVDTEVLLRALKQSAADTEVGNTWVIVPERDLKLNSRMSLLVHSGITTPEGPLLGNEEREIVGFMTYPEFRYVGFDCKDDMNSRSASAPATLPGECDPLKEMRLQFSVPVDTESVQKHCDLKPMKDKAAFKTYLEQIYTSGGYSTVPKEGEHYDLVLPRLMLARTEFTWSCTNKVIDIFGRPLKTPFTAKIKTAARAPAFVLAYDVGVLEKGVDSEIPIYLTNLNNVSVTYSARMADKNKTTQTLPLTPQKVQDIAYGVPLKVRTMLEGKSGAVYALVNTPDQPWLQSSTSSKGFYQVTPFYVHLKEGHFNSVIWVRDFATGKPIEGAEVSLITSAYSMIADPHKETRLGATGKDGRGELPGYIEYDPQLKLRSYSPDNEKLMILVKKGGDIAVLPLTYDFTAQEHWNADQGHFYSSARPKHGHVKVWGTSPQGVYRGGDAIDYKIYVRTQDQFRFVPANPGPYMLTVFDPTGKEVYKQKNIKLNEFGSFSGSFKTTKSSTVGWYQFQVSAAYLKANGTDIAANPESEGDGEGGEGGGPGPLPGLNSHRVLVTDFTPAPFRPENELDRPLYLVGQPLKITSRARLHSGGPYADAKARINVALHPTGFSAEGNRLAEQFQYSCTENLSEKAVTEKEVKLDAHGDQQEVVALTEKNIQCGRLIVTSDIADDRGKYFSAVKSAKYFSVGKLVGLRTDKFIYNENETAKIDFLVIDPESKIQRGTPVEIRVERQVVKKARVKGSGNAYLEEYKTEWEFVSKCEKKSSEKAETCTVPFKSAGYYRIEASVTDSKSQTNTNRIEAYVSGKSSVTWEERDSTGLKIIPSEKKPKVGETAKFLVQNPYPGGEALITIERYGILKSWTEKFSSSTPVVEVPITEDMLPGVHLSVTVFSPRVAQPLGDGEVDLGKPSFKMGYLQIQPENPVKELSLQVASDAKEYRPGSPVRLTMSAKSKSTRPPEKIEFAVAILDEAVFDLIRTKSDYFNIYKGFYQLDPLDVNNFSLLMKLIGRQKLEKKGANAGGDGAGLAMRSLFKYVAYWNPSVKADGSGQAKVDFKLPDNITGWRALVIATTPSDRMGLGQHVFQSNRPTEIRPVLPNIVREGDSFKAAFSIMNRTDKPRTLKVTAVASGHLSGEASTQKLEQVIQAAPYKRNIIELSLSAAMLKETSDVEEGKIQFQVSAGDNLDKDGLKVELPVLKKRVLLTEANYGTTTQDKVVEKVQIPKNIYADVGSARVTVSSTVIGNIQSAFQYMRAYPYICWEQRLTKGVFASSYEQLKPYLADSFLWPESKIVVKSLLEDAAAFQAPNGGMCYYIPNDQTVSPYLTAYTALSFQWLRSRGEKIPTTVEKKLNSYLLTMLRTDVAPTFYSQGMSSTVRAVALAALAKASSLQASDVLRYRLQLKTMDLFGKAHFLQAALKFKETEAAAKEALELILGAANATAGKFRFTDNLDQGWEMIHSSELRTQCAILSALSEAAEKPWASQRISDIPFKVVRFITATRAGNLPRWENTQENMFCTEALIDYSRRYESAKPDMAVSATFANQKMGEAKLTDFKQKPVQWTKPLSAANGNNATAIEIQRKGAGRLYYNASLTYAPKEDFKNPRNAGIEIRKEYLVERGGKFMLVNPPLKLKQGELLKVNLYVIVPSARNFVVVHDSVPGGLEVLNEDLGGTSMIDAKKSQSDYDRLSYIWQYQDWNYFSLSYSGFYFNEIRHDSVRYYSEFLEKGHYQLSYMAQAIAKGQFAILPASAEEMYDPDVFGKTPAAQIEVVAP